MKKKIVSILKSKKIVAVSLAFALLIVAGAFIIPSALKAKAAEVTANEVAEGMLDVKMQIQEVSGSLNMRLVSSVNGLGYSKVGFEVCFDADNSGTFADATEKVTFDTTTVLERINASKTGVTYKYSPKVIDTDAEYFVTGTLTNINQSKLANDFYVRAYVVSLDGNTTTYGTGRYFNIQDARKEDIINIPVADANGTLTVGSTVDVTVANVASTATVEANRDGYAHLNVAVPANATVTETKSANKTLLASANKIAVTNTSLSAVYRNLESAYANKGADDSWYQIDPNASAFIIATDADLFGFSSVSQSTDDFSGQTVYQVADITVNEGTAASTGFTAASGTTLKTWTAISNADKPFKGTFDGQEHKISGLSVSGNEGVFEVIDGGKVYNLKIDNSYFTGGAPVGALAGKASNGVLQNIDINAHVYASGGHVGGFLGQDPAGTLTMTDCHMVGGSVTSNSTIAGGIIGTNYGAVTFTDCSNNATVKAAGTDDADNTSSQAGGFVGRAEAGGALKFKSCINSGDVSTPKANAAGFIGLAKSAGNVTIDTCTNRGNVTTTTTQSAGFIGKYDNGNGTIQIINSRNEGSISSGTSVASGFIGFQWGTATIEQSVNAGSIAANSGYLAGFVAYLPTGGLTITDSQNESDISSASIYTGGFVGYSQQAVTIKNSENNGSITSNKDNVGGFVGFINKALVVEECTNKGDVTSSALYVGGYVGQLASGGSADIKKSNNEGSIKGTGSGDRNVAGFVGYAKGATLIIIDACINKGEVNTTEGSNIGGFVGKFDNTTGNLTIKNSDNEGAITSKVSVAGGFVGFQWGIVNIDNCKNKAAVTANSVGVGGFVAYQPTGSVTITNSQNEHAISSTAQYTGGFVGWGQPYVTIKNSTNNGAITSTKTETGGFVGILHAGALFENCVNKGTVTASTVNMAGFVGHQKNGEVQFKNSKNEANITNQSDKWYIGGFVGMAQDTLSFTKCTNSGAVTGNGNQIGGFVGTMAPNTNTSLTLTVTQCSNSGLVRGATGNCGGYVGYIGNVPTVTIQESQNSGEVVNATTATHTQYGGFVGWIKGGSISFAQCLNSGAMTSTQNNIGGFIGTSEATLTMEGCLNVGLITGGTQKGAFVGNAKCEITKSNVYASQESCDSVMFINYNGTVKWEKDATIQIPEANLKGATVFDYATGLDTTYWQATEEFPQLKCFIEPE